METAKRFSEAPWINNFPVTIGGLGGIGSNVAYLLAKHGVPIAMYDYDSVELHNIGGQFFDRRDIGKLKIDALSEKFLFIDRKLEFFRFPQKFIDSSTITSIAFACFDNMQARKDFYHAWKNYKTTAPKILIDGRQNAETLDIYAVTEETMDRYENEALFDDTEVEDLPCNFKATTQTGFLTSGLMVSIYTNFISNYLSKESVRSVPFRTQFIIPIMLYESNY